MRKRLEIACLHVLRDESRDADDAFASDVNGDAGLRQTRSDCREHVRFRGSTMKTLLDPSTLHSMLGPGFSVAIARPDLRTGEMFPEEERYIAGAVVKRRAEFATARVCARRALARIGVAPCPLVPNVDRSPFWPPGIKGSITHATDCCAVAVTDEPSTLAVGIDVERDAPLDVGLEALICVDEERTWLASAHDRGSLLRLIFSAKEAFYKCQYTTTRKWLDFLGVQLSIDLAGGTFSVVNVLDHQRDWAFTRSIRGEFRRCDGLIVTTAVHKALDRN